MTWSFAANETKLVMDGNDIMLVELSANTLKLKAISVSGGVTHTEEIIYGR